MNRSLLTLGMLLTCAAAALYRRQMIDDVYARNDVEALKLFRGFIERLFPKEGALDAFERQRLAEESVRTVYVHAHMDEDTFDCTRAMLCPDLVLSEPGRLIPACTYNLFYRMQDERFYRSLYANGACGGVSLGDGPDG